MGTSAEDAIGSLAVLVTNLCKIQTNPRLACQWSLKPH